MLSSVCLLRVNSGRHPRYSGSFGAWDVRILKTSEAQLGEEECCGFTLSNSVFVCKLHMYFTHAICMCKLGFVYVGFSLLFVSQLDDQS